MLSSAVVAYVYKVDISFPWLTTDDSAEFILSYKSLIFAYSSANVDYNNYISDSAVSILGFSISRLS